MKTQLVRILVMTSLGFSAAGSARAEAEKKAPVYKNPSAPIEERVTDLLSRMTLEEKVKLLSGKTGDMTQNFDELGIPSLKVTDGPHGVGWNVKATCFPSGVSMGACWNPDLVRRVAVALAEETRGTGRHVLLGPCINIHRTPLGGRNFESYSEDPYLAARTAVGYVQGVQSQKIGTSTKHYAVNNQEWERTTIDVRVDERALREIYLPAFKAAVQEADTWTIMAAYNRLNGPFCCASKPLLTDILKNEWGFKGVVVSDWGACHGTVDSAEGGLDWEMPGPGKYFGNDLLEAVKKGEVGEELINEKARRMLRLILRAGLLDPADPALKGAVATPEHAALARELSQEAIVLLKNSGEALPLKMDAIKSIAVLGPNAAKAQLGGGGSSTVNGAHPISPLTGLRKKCGDKVTVEYLQGCVAPEDIDAIPSKCLMPPDGKEGEHGLKAEYFSNKDLGGEPVLTRIDKEVDFRWGDSAPAPGIAADNFSVRWTGKLVPPEDGKYDLGMKSDDGFRIYLDGQLLIDSWRDQCELVQTKSVELKAGQPVDIKVEYYDSGGGATAKFGWLLAGDHLKKAVDLAAKSDVAIVFAGLSWKYEGEGFDRLNMDLPPHEAALIEAVAAANPNTIVVLINGTPVTMDRWLDKVPAVVEAWYPGEQGGNAIADVLFGDVNPSGKLPTTFPKRLEDSSSFANYPGANGVVNYAEGIWVGYRHFDRKNIEPLFPFGFGLSYTKFDYSNLKVDHPKVTCEVENTGSRAGKEVVQLYIRDVESSLERPVRELKGFRKVDLQPGEKKTVEFTLDDSSLAFYDPAKKQWIVEPGEFEIQVGSSSRDIRLTATMKR